jgi:hypothetical protein
MTVEPIEGYCFGCGGELEFRYNTSFCDPCNIDYYLQRTESGWLLTIDSKETEEA